MKDYTSLFKKILQSKRFLENKKNMDSKNDIEDYFDEDFFVLNYRIIKGANKIVVTLAGNKEYVVPNTKENEIKILERMKKQVLLLDISKDVVRKELKNKITLFENLIAILVIILAISGIGFALAILSTVKIIAGIVGGASFISSLTLAIKNKKLIELNEDIEKNLCFLENQETFEKYLKDYNNSLFEVKEVSKNIITDILKENKNLNVNNIEMIDLDDIKRISTNIKREKKYNFDYQEETKPKQKGLNF